MELHRRFYITYGRKLFYTTSLKRFPQDSGRIIQITIHIQKLIRWSTIPAPFYYYSLPVKSPSFINMASTIYSSYTYIDRTFQDIGLDLYGYLFLCDVSVHTRNGYKIIRILQKKKDNCSLWSSRHTMVPMS